MTLLPLPEKAKDSIEDGQKLLCKFYDDLLQPSVKEIGSVLRDITKTIAILSYPFMLGASLKDRLSARVYKIAEAVPENVRVMPNSQVFLDYLDKTKFLQDKSIILDAYNNLLASAMNSRKKDSIHPAFFWILPQLSPDELKIITKLRNFNCKITIQFGDEIISEKPEKDNISNHSITPCDPISLYAGIKLIVHPLEGTIVETDFPTEVLYNKELLRMYYSRLEKLGIIVILDTKEILTKPGRHIHTLTLSEFGKLFEQVCRDN